MLIEVDIDNITKEQYQAAKRIVKRYEEKEAWKDGLTWFGYAQGRYQNLLRLTCVTDEEAAQGEAILKRWGDNPGWGEDGWYPEPAAEFLLWAQEATHEARTYIRDVIHLTAPVMGLTVTEAPKA